jgi:phosphopentomutase
MRVIILVLDSFGIGATEDAAKFGDEGSNTFLHIAQACAKGECEQGRSGLIKLPNLAKLGLGHAGELSCGTFAPGLDPQTEITGAYGYAEQLSSGKDTPSGHWEMAGVPVLFDWGYFTDKENAFPPELINEFVKRTKIPGILGNCHASGTTILEQLGEEHMTSGKPICYTSGDSVFQIAAHEQTFGVERLLEICLIARDMLDEYNIGRVIARPFVGTESSNFARTGNRRDYSVLPPAPTVLDKLTQAGGSVISIGKIADIFAQQGITHKIKATGLEQLLDTTLDAMASTADNSIIFTNLVDFDSSYGHRRDTNGYAAALERFDQRLPELLNALGKDDIILLSADHGCDPTWPGSDHTRENIPVLAYGHSVTPGSIGKRSTFADIGQSIASVFALPAMDYGQSFLTVTLQK